CAKSYIHCTDSGCYETCFDYW
nr:immunoglobulin heavy chain junction region [Macaca mulatta]MOY28066.1 immunoglobulin heavy chain junction region [Macaca mulatta]